MDFPQRVYSSHWNGKQTLTSQTLLAELQVPVGTYCEILRVWITPDLTVGGPQFFDARIQVSIATLPATGGAAMTINDWSGEGASTCTTLRQANPKGVQNAIMQNAFSLRNGFEWIPHPDERPMIVGGTADRDNFGVTILNTAGDAWTSIQLNCGFIWRELS